MYLTYSVCFIWKLTHIHMVWHSFECTLAMAAIDQTSPVLVCECNSPRSDWSGHGTTRVNTLIDANASVNTLIDANTSVNTLIDANTSVNTLIGQYTNYKFVYHSLWKAKYGECQCKFYTISSMVR